MVFAKAAKTFRLNLYANITFKRSLPFLNEWSKTGYTVLSLWIHNPILEILLIHLICAYLPEVNTHTHTHKKQLQQQQHEQRFRQTSKRNDNFPPYLVYAAYSVQVAFSKSWIGNPPHVALITKHQSPANYLFGVDSPGLVVVVVVLWCGASDSEYCLIMFGWRTLINKP